MRVINGKGTVMEGEIRTCCGCNNPVVLASTERGAMLPLDPEPAETGTLAVSVPGPGKAPRVRYLRGDDVQLEAGEQQMRAHWDTHPRCRPARKGRKHATTQHHQRPGNGRATPPGAEGPDRVHVQQTAGRTPEGGREAEAPGAAVIALRDPRDLTLDQLAAADLNAILAAAGARPKGTR